LEVKDALENDTGRTRAMRMLLGRITRLILACSLLVGGLASVLAQAGAAQADAQPKTVLELFTSQGCSSCPAADALLKSYIQRPDVIALSLAVDYWDYLGWKDTLADPAFTKRQKYYSKMRGDGRIYTPQIVVNGLAHVNGAHAAEIDHAIVKTSGKLAGERVAMKLSTGDGKLTIETGAVAEGDRAREGTIWLAVFQNEVQVPVRAGENKGQTLTYYNVVRELKSVGNWTGKPATIQLERTTVMKAGADGCAVLLQVGQTGPILGAAMLTKW
jgi:hypothetical protein